MNSFRRILAFHIELEFEGLVFEERGKPKYPEKNLWNKGEKQQQTQPTDGSFDAEVFNLGHIGDRQVLLPLGHPFSATNSF